MRRLKALPSVSQPDPLMQQLMNDQGFSVRKDHQGTTKYQAKIQDVSCSKEYVVSIPVQSLRDGVSRLMMNEAVFEGEHRVPQPVTEAAFSKLQEVADYMKSSDRGHSFQSYT